MKIDKIISLRMERQHLDVPADEAKYIALYRDCQPGHNVYWNGFGQPPTLSFRAAFDDLNFNAQRQKRRQLIKGRFAGGNLGWIVPEDLGLFKAVYEKPMKEMNFAQLKILETLKRTGPLNIQQMKEETGLLVKEITPALHRLQQTFEVYEDQYDGEWDRSWYCFEEMFPEGNFELWARQDAIKELIVRFAERIIFFDVEMARDFYKLPVKELRMACASLCEDGIMVEEGEGYMLRRDREYLEEYTPKTLHSIYALHRNDFLYKANESRLQRWIQPLIENLPYDHEPLQYLLIDGEFRGACVGHFRNGPYDLNDIVCDFDECRERKDEIVDAVRSVNYGKMPLRFMGKLL